MPLGDQHPGRNDDHDEQASPVRISYGCQRHVGLSRPGNGLDNPSAASGQPCSQCIELPRIEIPVRSDFAGHIAPFAQTGKGIGRMLDMSPAARRSSTFAYFWLSLSTVLACES